MILTLPTHSIYLHRFSLNRGSEWLIGTALVWWGFHPRSCLDHSPIEGGDTIGCSAVLLSSGSYGYPGAAFGGQAVTGGVSWPAPKAELGVHFTFYRTSRYVPVSYFNERKCMCVCVLPHFKIRGSRAGRGETVIDFFVLCFSKKG